jgi:hypothetical protein
MKRSKQGRDLADGLGGAQKEHAVRIQGVVKERDQVGLQIAVEIDQQVATTDEIHPGEGRILHQILLGEDQEIAHHLLNAVAHLGGLREEARQPRRRDLGRDAFRIETGAGLRDGARINVGREELHLVGLFEGFQMLAQQDSDGIRLFPGGAAADPDPQGRARRLDGKQTRNDLLLQGGEGIGIAEEIGDPDQ